MGSNSDDRNLNIVDTITLFWVILVLKYLFLKQSPLIFPDQCIATGKHRLKIYCCDCVTLKYHDNLQSTKCPIECPTSINSKVTPSQNF